MSDDEQATSGSVRGRRVGVTGATRGIGRATAILLVSRGATVFATGRDESALASLRKMCGDQVIPSPCDLSDPGARADLVHRAEAALGGLDGWVNAAGVADHKPLHDTSDQDIKKGFEVNLHASIDLCRQARGPMSNSGGSIVNVASTLADHPVAGTSTYAGSKAAMIASTKAIALEFAAQRIRVNAIAPGAIETDMITKRPASERERLRRQHLLGRFGTQEEVSEGIAYLLTANWVTGTVLYIDGGLTV